jgi:hypothetical protein
VNALVKRLRKRVWPGGSRKSICLAIALSTGFGVAALSSLVIIRSAEIQLSLRTVATSS